MRSAAATAVRCSFAALPPARRRRSLVMRRIEATLPENRLSASQRKEQLKAAAEPRRALDLDAPAERKCELARDREAEPGPTAVTRPERPEDPLAFLRPDARTRVGHDDGDRS